MKIEDFRPIRSQDSAPIKFDWLLTQESDWIIWTNQKITLIIFWLVKNGKDWNPAIPLVKRIFLVPDHIWPKTIKGQPALTHVIRNYVLLLVVPPLCLWWVTHSDESAQAQNSSRATTTLVSHPPHSTELTDYKIIARPKGGLLRYHVKRIHFTMQGFGFLSVILDEAKLKAGYYMYYYGSAAII